MAKKTKFDEAEWLDVLANGQDSVHSDAYPDAMQIKRVLKANEIKESAKVDLSHDKNRLMFALKKAEKLDKENEERERQEAEKKQTKEPMKLSWKDFKKQTEQVRRNLILESQLKVLNYQKVGQELCHQLIHNLLQHLYLMDLNR